MNPIRYENEVPIFTTDQIDILGLPTEYGYDKFIVIEGKPTYDNHINLEHSRLIKKHKYSRLLRFKMVVRNLFGETKAKVFPNSVIGVVKELTNPESETIYNDCRSILKHYRFQKLYILIPTILYKAHNLKMLEIPNELKKDFSEILQEVYTRFIVFENLFYELGDKNRKYFPNLKYTALRILCGMGVINKFIPVLRTERKINSLDSFFKQMEDILEKRLIVK